MTYADLHMHTSLSDGRLDPTTLVKENAILGLETIAITDHDTMRAYPEAKKAAELWNIELVPGVEVTTRQYHILGLGVNPESKEFQEFLQYSQKLQARINDQRIGVLQEHGVPITMDKVKEMFPEARIGKFNIAMAMMMDPECRNYLSNIPGHEMYDKTLGRYGYDFHIDKSKQVHNKSAIDKIHEAGGIAILAHPFKDVEHMKELDDLVELGLDGVEVQPHFKMKNNPFEEYAQRNGLIITYGSDFHGPSKPERPLLGRRHNIEPVWEKYREAKLTI